MDSDDAPASFDGVQLNVATRSSDEKAGAGLSAAEAGTDLRTYREPCWQSRKLWLALAAILATLAAIGAGVGIALGVVRARESHADASHAHGAHADHADFIWTRSQFFPEYNFTVNEYIHKVTGAEVLSVRSADINKAAGIVFRTTVSSDQGMPHLLMHAVLMGSKDYPTHNPPPFWRLQQSSFSTYLGGMVYPDRTLFPFSSVNLHDFYNLLDVYLDGVFHPLVLSDERLLKQEGWYISLHDSSKPWTAELKGVVVSKITDWMGNPFARLSQFIQESLFPNNTYSFSHAGRLTALPTLTHSQVTEYYQLHYHPSNARFWFYGDDDEYTRLDKIADKLQGYARGNAASTAVQSQQLFDSPKAVSGYYPGVAASGMFVVSAWVIDAGAQGMSSHDSLAWVVLEELLSGTAEAPLQAAMDGLGIGVAYTTLDFDYLQPTFTVGYRGVEVNDTRAAEMGSATIIRTLELLTQQAFNSKDVEAAIHTVQMRLRKSFAESSTIGVDLLQSIAAAWVHGNNVFDELAMEAGFAFLRQRLQMGERVFENLIKQHLLLNTHRVDVIFRPDVQLLEKELRAADDIVQAFLKGKHKSELDRLVEDTIALDEWGSQPDNPDDVGKIPMLSVSNLSPDVEAIPEEVVTMASTLAHPPALLLHRQDTNGLLCATLALNVTSDLTEDTLALLPLLVIAMQNLGTKDMPPEQFWQEVRARTGGLAIRVVVDTPQNGAMTDAPFIMLEITSSALSGSVPDMLNLLFDTLEYLALDEEEASAIMIRELDLASRRVQENLQSQTFSVISTRARAQWKPESWVEERLEGISYIEHVNEWSSKLARPGGWDELRGQLTQLLDAILNEPRVFVSLVGDATILQDSRPAAMGLLMRIMDASSKTEAPSNAAPWRSMARRRNEAVVTHGGSNMVVYGAQAPAPYEFHGSDLVATALLNSYLIAKVRLAGGAFDSWVTVSPDGYIAFKSYVDPNLEGTVKIFDSSTSHLRQLADGLESANSTEKNIRQRDLVAAIITAVKDFFPYMSPVEKGELAFRRFLRGTRYADLRKWRLEAIKTRAADLRRFADAIDASAPTLVAAIPNATSASIVNGMLGQLRFDAIVTDLYN